MPQDLVAQGLAAREARHGPLAEAALNPQLFAESGVCSRAWL